MAIHEYFQKNGYIYVNTPIITSSDGEGAGEMFKITTLKNEEIVNEAEKLVKQNKKHPITFPTSKSVPTQFSVTPV